MSAGLVCYLNVAAAQVAAQSRSGLWNLTVDQDIYKKQTVTVYTWNLKLFGIYSVSNAYCTFVSQDLVYHFIAFLCYIAAFVLEAATTAANGGMNILPNSTDIVFCITNPVGNIFTILDSRQYNINVAATVSAVYLFHWGLLYCTHT